MSLQTILNLQFTGVQGSQSVVDTSPSAHPVTVSGGAAVDIIAGEPRMRFVGSGSFVHTPDGPDFSFASKDWQIDFQVRLNAACNHALIAQYNNGNGNDLLELTHKSGDGLRLLLKSGGSSLLDVSQVGSPFQPGIDYDVTVRRVGSTVTILRNGVVVLSGTLSAPMPDPTSPFYLGYGFYSFGASAYLDGWLDRFIVQKDDAVPPPPPPAPPAWRAGVPVVSSHAPLGAGPSGNAATFLFVNTTIPSTFAEFPPTTYPAPGLFVPQSWHRINVKQRCGIPVEDEILAVKIAGIIGLTMGNSPEIGDLHIHLRKPGSGNNNYIFQTDAVNAGGGDRDNADATVAVLNDEIEFAWWVSSPLDYPVHAAYFFNLNLYEYLKAGA